MKSNDRDHLNGLGTTIIGCAIRVHRALGPGLLESAYQACFAHELERTGLVVECEVRVPLTYRELRLDIGYRLDMLVEGLVVIENKAVERILPIHKAQILTYLELTGYRLGYLLNWHSPLMKGGVNRFVHRF